MNSLPTRPRMISIPLLAVALVWMSLTALAQEHFPSAEFRSGGGVSRPNVELPASVLAPDGKFTLYADFNGQTGGGVPLYLVNRTNKAIKLSTQDGDLFVKLEYQMADGSWQRAQAHYSSWCGNSYYPMSLLPGQHCRMAGYQPHEGSKARVRFVSSANQLVSNEGDGVYLPRDAEDSLFDGMGGYVAGTISELLQANGPMRSADISPESSVVALRLLQAYGPNPYLQRATVQLAESWEKKGAPSAAEVTGAKAIREILAEPWPEKGSSEALLSVCIKALSANPEQKGFGLPGNHPVIVWRVLADLAEAGTIKKPEAWKPLIDFVLARDKAEDVYGIIRVAARPQLADELIPNSFFEKHLLSGDSYAQSVCATALARRGNQERLVELGWKLKPPEQIRVFAALAHRNDFEELFSDEAPGPVHGTSEAAFWRHCLKVAPIEAAYVLSSGRSQTPPRYDRIVHGPLHEFLDAEATKSAAAAADYELGPDAYKLRMAVEVLASFERREDVPVLQKLLEHRGFQKSEYVLRPGEYSILQRFEIRRAAKKALLQREEWVPDGLVVERKLP